MSKNYIAENVVEQVDFKKLDAAISRAEALREADYKDFRAVKAALLAAKALDRENATQADADKLAADITTAIANLEAATPDPTPGPTPTPDPTPTPTPGTGDSNGNGGNSQGTTEDNNNDESDNEQSRTEESVATGERGFSLWYALSAAIASLGAGLALTGKKRRKDEE